MGVLKIIIKLKLFKLFLICLLVQTIYGGDNANYLKCTKAKELDADCGKYCYQIVKPLLQHATVVHDKEKEFTKLRDTIQDQQIIIKNFEVQQVQIDLLSSYKAQLADKDALFEELQQKINKKQSEATLKIEDLQEIINENQSETNAKIKELADKNALIKDLQEEINENQSETTTYIKELAAKNALIEELEKKINENEELKKKNQSETHAKIKELAAKNVIIEELLEKMKDNEELRKKNQSKANAIIKELAAKNALIEELEKKINENEELKKKNQSEANAKLKELAAVIAELLEKIKDMPRTHLSKNCKRKFKLKNCRSCT